MHDVIVVGAGPVGLWTAAELKQQGVDVVVVDRASQRDPRSRAVGMSAGTVETFATRGIAERFITAGIPIASSHFGASSTRLRLDVLGIRHLHSLCIPQAVTETLLEDYCSTLGVPVWHGHEVTGLDHTDHGVVVHLADSTKLHAQWVVGADGTKSVVRTAAGIAFPGRDGTHTGWLADVHVQREPQGPLGGVSAAGSVLMQAIGDGLYRLAGVDTATMHLPPEQPPSLEQVRRWAIDTFGDDYGMHSPLWISRYGNATRLADSFRQGRVLLAGDAAHQFFPAGGQGMNTGIQDGTNLAWKLAATIHGNAPDGLLDTYSDERRIAASAIIHNTDAQLALFAARTPAEAALRTVFSEALAHPDINATWARRITGFADPVPAGQRYDQHPSLGSRVTHLILNDDPDALHTQMTPGRFLLIDFNGDSGVASEDFLLHHPQVDLYTGPCRTTDRKWEGTSAVLLRPDARIAWVGEKHSTPGDLRRSLVAALSMWTLNPTATASAESQVREGADV